MLTVADTPARLLGQTPLVRIRSFVPDGVRLFAKIEERNPTGSTKDRVARAMLDAAEADGILDDRTLIEASSGNTAIALAMLARLGGRRMAAVVPDSVSEERRALLRAYGVEVFLSDGDLGPNGAVRLATEMAERGGYLMLDQYRNAANPGAHERGTGAEIVDAVPDVDLFVAGIGTGGTITGVGRRLKRHDPRISVVGVEPVPGERIAGLRSLADGYVPEVLDLDVVDDRCVVTAADAFAMTRELLLREGILAGVSSGAVMVAALRYAERLGARTVVVPFADGGWRYLSTGVHVDGAAGAASRDAGLGRVWW